MNPLNPSEEAAPDKHDVELAIWLIDEHDDEDLEGHRDSKVELQGPPAVRNGDGDCEHCL
jgi:hypothetical protein